MRDNHRVVMTHGDLHPRNIMVKWITSGPDVGPSDGNKELVVTSLIDWEMGGWYPEYWEFVKAVATVDARSPLADWIEFLPTRAIGSWPIEFSLDSIIDRWLG